jgi:metal-responsive CopG/Arc/MetJ family transcriptional regulator
VVKEITRDFLLRLPPELFKQLEREVKVQKSSRTKLVRKVLADYLNWKEDDRDLDRDLKSERAKEVAPEGESRAPIGIV